jgi:hypothetical protein
MSARLANVVPNSGARLDRIPMWHQTGLVRTRAVLSRIDISGECKFVLEEEGYYTHNYDPIAVPVEVGSYANRVPDDARMAPTRTREKPYSAFRKLKSTLGAASTSSPSFAFETSHSRNHYQSEFPPAIIVFVFRAKVCFIALLRQHARFGMYSRTIAGLLCRMGFE